MLSRDALWSDGKTDHPQMTQISQIEDKNSLLNLRHL